MNTEKDRTMTDTTNINSAKYNTIMGDRHLDGPLDLLPEKINKFQAKKKSGLQKTTALAIAITITFIGGLYLDASSFNSHPVIAFIIALLNSMLTIMLITVIFMLSIIIFDHYRSRIIYRDVLEHIDELINFFKKYHLLYRREYHCDQPHDHEKEGCKQYQITCGFFLKNPQSDKEGKDEEFIKLGSGRARVVAVKQAKETLDTWCREEGIKDLDPTDFEDFVLRKLREQAANQKNIQVLAD